ncbi:hypothetical protein PR001_g10017 [Phytophthora rubi]|uniref:RxLR effector protein n=1 Tax=Phytophthora rubi TaxID=129364 RepID=A0A6A3MX41_9STRA|nr:hypothetical protein PR001_g10017 [Phytophthora rubi]
MTTVFCCFVAISLCLDTMSNAVALSRPVVTSSMKVANFVPNSISPVVTRLRSPPDTPRLQSLPIFVSRQVFSPSCSMIKFG